MIDEHRVHEDDDRTRPLLDHLGERAVNLIGTTRVEKLQAHLQGAGALLRRLQLC